MRHHVIKSFKFIGTKDCLAGNYLCLCNFHILYWRVNSIFEKSYLGYLFMNNWPNVEVLKCFVEIKMIQFNFRIIKF